MKKEVILELIEKFENNSHKIEKIEYWYARDLQKLLGYTKWENFYKVIEKSKEACKNSKFKVYDHFADIKKMVELGSGAKREIEDIMLTRYACYLIAQNGDSKKEEISFAQSYFAIQTRKQELIEKRITLQERFYARNKLINSETELSKLIYEKGVDQAGFGRIRSKGDKALFGGFNTKEIKNKLNIPKNKPLADFLPTVTIAAKNFATEITNFNTKHKDLNGEIPITNEHIKNNKEMRRILIKNKIIPEELPVEEDIKKLERKIKKEEKKINKDKFPKS